MAASSMLTDHGRWPLDQSQPTRVTAAAELLGYAVSVGERIEAYEASLKKDCESEEFKRIYAENYKKSRNPESLHDFIITLFNNKRLDPTLRTIVVNNDLEENDVFEVFFSSSTLYKLKTTIYSLRELCCRIIRSQSNGLPFIGFRGANNPLAIYRNQPVDGSERSTFYRTAADYLIQHDLSEDIARDILKLLFKRHHLLGIHVDQLERAVQNVCNSEKPWLRYEGLDGGEYFVVNSPLEFVGDLLETITLPLQYKSIEMRERNIADVEQYEAMLLKCMTDIGQVIKPKTEKGYVRVLGKTPSQSSVDSSRSTEDQQYQSPERLLLARYMYHMNQLRPGLFNDSYTLEGNDDDENRMDTPEEKDAPEEKEAAPLDDDDDDLIITLAVSGSEIEIERGMAKRSNFIKALLQGDRSVEKVDFRIAVTQGTLEVLKVYLTNDSTNWSEELKESKMDTANLVDLIKGLHYLDMEGQELLKLACWEFATRISKIIWP